VGAEPLLLAYLLQRYHVLVLHHAQQSHFSERGFPHLQHPQLLLSAPEAA
jgi:hypothetical protein